MMIIKKFQILFGLFILIFLFFGFLFLPQFQKANIFHKAKAITDTNTELSGWLWSSNIGWVSLNCKDMNICATSDYKVLLDSQTGNLTGYAWSDNIGWIQFNPVGPYPESPDNSAKVDYKSNTAAGWIKVLSADKINGEWDGWIKFIDVKYEKSGSKLTGYAWGGLVVGWFNFNAVMPAAIDCDFRAVPNIINIIATTTKLYWDCNSLTTSCSINSPIFNANNISLPKGNTSSVGIDKTTKFTLTCQGLGGPIDFNLEVKRIDLKIDWREIIPR